MNFTESQCFHECFSEFCNGRVIDNVIKNLSYPPIQDNAGFQLATTKILFKSKIISSQRVEYSSSSAFIRTAYQKQPVRDLLRKRCSENIQQIYRRTFMPKWDFNEVAFQLYWNHTSAWMFSRKFQNTFP